MLKKTIDLLRQELSSISDEKERDWEWMKTYLGYGAGMSHVAAGEALAAAVVSVALLTQDGSMCRAMMENPRRGQSGKEDFRFAFLHHVLLRLVESYETDDMVSALEFANEYQGMKLLAFLIEELGYLGGQLAEDIGFQA